MKIKLGFDRKQKLTQTWLPMLPDSPTVSTGFRVSTQLRVAESNVDPLTYYENISGSYKPDCVNDPDQCKSMLNYIHNECKTYCKPQWSNCFAQCDQGNDQLRYRWMNPYFSED